VAYPSKVSGEYILRQHARLQQGHLLCSVMNMQDVKNSWLQTDINIRYHQVYFRQKCP